MHDLNLVVHIAAGCIALAIGLVPFFAKKGSSLHRKSGRIFLAVMAVVLITAFLGVAFFRSRPFLVVVTVLATYTSLGGWRALCYKSMGPGKFDLLLSLSAFVTGILFLFYASSDKVVWNRGVVYYLLCYMFLICIYDFIRIAGIIRSEKIWLIEHAVKMTSAFGALFSAAIGTVLAGWEPYNQIIPAILSTCLNGYLIWYFCSKQPRLQKIAHYGK